MGNILKSARLGWPKAEASKLAVDNWTPEQSIFNAVKIKQTGGTRRALPCWLRVLVVVGFLRNVQKHAVHWIPDMLERPRIRGKELEQCIPELTWEARWSGWWRRSGRRCWRSRPRHSDLLCSDSAPAVWGHCSRRWSSPRSPAAPLAAFRRAEVEGTAELQFSESQVQSSARNSQSLSRAEFTAVHSNAMILHHADMLQNLGDQTPPRRLPVALWRITHCGTLVLTLQLTMSETRAGGLWPAFGLTIT